MLSNGDDKLSLSWMKHTEPSFRILLHKVRYAIALHQLVQESRWQLTLWVTVATSIKPASNGLVTVEGDRAILLGIMQIVTSTVRVDVTSTKSSRVHVHDFLLPL